VWHGKTFHANDFEEIAEPREKHFDEPFEDQYLIRHKMRKL
jgi:3-methyladenine DNA glycosylase Tag